MNSGTDYYKTKLIYNKKETKVKFLKNARKWANYALSNPKSTKYQNYCQKILMNRRLLRDYTTREYKNWRIGLI